MLASYVLYMYRPIILTFELTRNECKVEGQIQIQAQVQYKDGNKARSLNFDAITPRAPIYAV